ncbi:GTP-binding protein 8-like [Ptychodera flava]|uniref:GTP-binding protein 8-like n=1 Tax=Ptychodera flava TaxID=63121 RepID=UPI00396A6F41
MQGHATKSMLAFAKEAVSGISKCSSLNSIRHASRVSRTSTKGASTLDPLKPLQPMSAIPILEDSERIFVPTAEDIRQGEDLFTASKTNEIGFVLSAPKPEFAPKHDMPEVAFVGRSNVGKSSLIKAIFKKAPGVVVKTSKTPGHTKTVNFFQVGRHLMLVDMPGYGFRQPRDFAESAEAYLATRKNLKNTVLLIDCNTGVKDVDLLAIEMLEQFSLPYMIVLTKIDRPSKHLLLRSVFDTKAVIWNHTSFCLPQPFLVSSLNLDGVAMLKAFIGITSGVITQSQMADSPNSSR